MHYGAVWCYLFWSAPSRMHLTHWTCVLAHCSAMKPTVVDFDVFLENLQVNVLLWSDPFALYGPSANDYKGKRATYVFLESRSIKKKNMFFIALLLCIGGQVNLFSNMHVRCYNMLQSCCIISFRSTNNVVQLLVWLNPHWLDSTGRPSYYIGLVNVKLIVQRLYGHVVACMETLMGPVCGTHTEKPISSTSCIKMLPCIAVQFQDWGQRVPTTSIR